MLDNSRQQTTDCNERADDPPIHTTRRRQKSRGQSMVELAILLPALIMILAVAADFGRALTAYIAISSAAREGAAYGMQSSDQAADTAGIELAAKNDIGSGGQIWGTAVDVDPLVSIDAQGYEQVEVTVSYSFDPIIPLPDIVPTWDVPTPIEMDRTVKMRVLN